MQTLEFDLIIVGSGPIGLACAIAAQEAGLHYVVLEKGCLTNAIYNYPQNMTFFSTSERLEIGNIPFVSVQPKPTRAEALEYYRRVAQHFQLNIRLFEAVEAITPQQNGFTVSSTQQTYKARYVVLATGFYDIPNLLQVPGEDLPKVTHYYRDPHYYALQDVLVVGANNSAVDAALETWRKGARVTMVIRGDAIGKRVKYWVRPDIENRIAEGSIKAYFHSQVTAIREKEVDLITPDGPLTLPNDFVLAMTGYRPNLEFLTKVGVQLSNDATREPVYNSETFETNVRGLYLAGVVCGGMNTHRLFIENSREHALRIIGHIAARQAGSAV
ncbi:MAG: YpdA family putative bacillithiol disulfide reductase [Lacibacter sp.]